MAHHNHPRKRRSELTAQVKLEMLDVTCVLTQGRIGMLKILATNPLKVVTSRKLKSYFDVDEAASNYVLTTTAKKWRDFKAELKKKFDATLTDEDNMKNVMLELTKMFGNCLSLSGENQKMRLVRL